MDGTITGTAHIPTTAIARIVLESAVRILVFAPETGGLDSKFFQKKLFTHKSFA